MNLRALKKPVFMKASNIQKKEPNALRIETHCDGIYSRYLTEMKNKVFFNSNVISTKPVVVNPEIREILREKSICIEKEDDSGNTNF